MNGSKQTRGSKRTQGSSARSPGRAPRRATASGASSSGGSSSGAGRTHPARKGSPQGAPRRRFSTLRLTPTGRQRIYVAIVVVVLIVGGLVAWFSPLLSVREIQVQGARNVSEEEVRSTLGVPTGTPLLRVDLDTAAARVAALPWVAGVTVNRHYPSDLTVVVTERMPTMFVDKPDGTHLLDASGVEFTSAPPPPGLPRLVTPNPGPEEALTEAALAAITALPEQVRTQVEQVTPESVVDVRLDLSGGRTVLWGTPEDSRHKGAVLAALLSQPGKTYDVSSPDLPTIS